MADSVKRADGKTDESPIEHSKGYKDAVEKVPQSDLLQESTMPKGPDPSPFKLGPMAGGDRK